MSHKREHWGITEYPRLIKDKIVKILKHLADSPIVGEINQILQGA